jgi:general secretion pathway protein J
MLAALAVVALTLVAAASGLRQLAGSADRGAQVIARHDMFSSGISVLRRDVERLERVIWKRGQNTEFVFHADATNLTFVAIEPPFPSEPGTYFVAYAIVRIQTVTCHLTAALLSISRQRTFGGCPGTL